jgi:uncharacterized membrane protein
VIEGDVGGGNKMRTGFLWLMVSIVGFVLLIGEMSLKMASWRLFLFTGLALFGFVMWLMHDEAKYSGDMRVAKKG